MGDHKADFGPFSSENIYIIGGGGGGVCKKWWRDQVVQECTIWDNDNPLTPMPSGYFHESTEWISFGSANYNQNKYHFISPHLIHNNYIVCCYIKIIRKYD